MKCNGIRIRIKIRSSDKITCDYGGDGTQMSTRLSDFFGGGFGALAACSGGADEVLEHCKRNGRGRDFEETL